ncbi:MAG TPA: hypothetical protein VNK23_17245 [Candidatus Dormibacteraeota bacterium]|nr:hypothetical protein [Candidatus Dormibacteraeota bacterium]
MPKRVCTNRAEWRLVRGQRAQHLSAHYRLECDYGTAFLTIYNEGDAVYLCEGHASAVRNSEAPTIAGVRLVQHRRPSSSQTVSSEALAEIVLSEGAIPSASIPATPGAEAIQLNFNAAESIEAPIQTARLEVPEPSEPAVPELQIADLVAPTPTASEPQAIEIDAPAMLDAPIQTPQDEAAKPCDAEAPEPKPQPALAPSARREFSRPVSVKAFARDLMYGDCAKALVDEAIWNLEPGDYEAYQTALLEGKPAAEASQAAGGQLAIILRRISEYTVKIEGLLLASDALIDAASTIDKPLEQAMLDIIADGTLSDADKDAAVDHLGSLQKEMNGGLDRVISPLKAHRIAISIGERANWGARSDLAEEVKSAYRSLYSSVRQAVLAAVPEARIFDERLTNLYAAKSDIASAAANKVQHSVAR